jgi:hypothetical protein
MSRFWRVGLPSPKRYVMLARLAWAAHLAESPAMTVNSIAMRLDASSPQALGRTIRTVMGLTAVEFRRRYDGAAMLASFRGSLIDPYRELIRRFDPLCTGRGELPAANERPEDERGEGRAA